MSQVRPAAVAGLFYPRAESALRSRVTELLDAAAPADVEPLARAYVVPHAGYRFSGAVAAEVYARLRPHAARLRRIVLIGPSHRAPLSGAAASPAQGWQTPLGTVRTESADAVCPADPAPHAAEHSLEVQLPFVQLCADSQVSVVPVAVGKSTAAEIADVLDQLVDSKTLLLCSTDFSHFHDEATAKRRDRATADAVLQLRDADLSPGDACGFYALRGAVAWAARHGLNATELDLKTSADTVGNPDRVVGYPAFAMQ